MKSCVVKRKISAKSFLPILLILVLTLAVYSLLRILGLEFFPILVVLLGIFFAALLTPRYMRTEYEYAIEGDDFTVSLILNRSARKELFSADITRLSSCAPSHLVVAPQKKLNAYVGKERYTALFTLEEGPFAVIFSPDAKFLEEMRLIAPSKVRLESTSNDD